MSLQKLKPVRTEKYAVIHCSRSRSWRTLGWCSRV